MAGREIAAAGDKSGITTKADCVSLEANCPKGYLKGSVR